jgi:hypothetical protein
MNKQIIRDAEATGSSLLADHDDTADVTILQENDAHYRHTSRLGE